MTLVPSLLLKQLYTHGSLSNEDGGVSFAIKNRLSDATLTGLMNVKIGGKEVALDQVKIELGDGKPLAPKDITGDDPVDFPLRKTFRVVAKMDALPVGRHSIEVAFEATPFGKLELQVDDAISDGTTADTKKIPRDDLDDYSEKAIKTRQIGRAHV